MDIMLDIETLGLSPGAMVVSVGACSFDRKTGDIGDEFHSAITIKSSTDAGLKMEPQTVMWWMTQSDDAKSSWVKKGYDLKKVASEFSLWLGVVSSSESSIWAQGDMDCNVWGFAMESVGVVRPWPFWAIRDTRTAYDVCGFDPRTIERSGTYHNALDDAKHQVRCLVSALSK